MLTLSPKILLVPITLVITSLFIFPFYSSFLPSVNTKMFMAGGSLVLLALQMAKGRTASADNHLMTASIYACVVSLIGLTSVIYNGATDYTYASYIVSMWVWLGGAYVVVSIIRVTHGGSSVLLICNYLITVCVCQCIIALLVDSGTIVKDWVDALLVGDGFMGKPANRMYGIGCALDVAGMKFGSVEIMIAVIIRKIQNTQWQKYQVIYFAAFLFIAVVGSMIGRTTYVGVAISFFYWIYAVRHHVRFNSAAFKIAACLFLITIVVLNVLYNHNETFYKNFRFAFEGFFSIVEKGYWETNSNNNLQTMVVWPDNFKTWIIGDGYFENPLSTNPYYIGKGIASFYMKTDIGYCRFLFYFGILGLLSFMIFFIRICYMCCKRLDKFKVMFILILVANFIIWTKVSSDLFPLFAPFLLLSQIEDEENSIILNPEDE